VCARNLTMPPEILLATVNVHEEFVQVPNVAQPSLSAPEATGIRRTEGPTPLSDRLVRHGDAPLGEEIFSISEAQTEPVVQPDSVTDDLWWESVAVVPGTVGHPPTLPAATSA
jgi:hypothetical protein